MFEIRDIVGTARQIWSRAGDRCRGGARRGGHVRAVGAWLSTENLQAPDLRCRIHDDDAYPVDGQVPGCARATARTAQTSRHILLG